MGMGWLQLKEVSSMMSWQTLLFAAQTMQKASHSVDFVLYLFMGRKFRREFIRLFTKCCRGEN